MYKAFLAIAALALCASLSACDASFTDPMVQKDTTKTPPIDSSKLYWYFMQNIMHQNIDVLANGAECELPYILPSNAQVVVAWEIPHSSPNAMYVIYNGTMTTLSNYGFEVRFADSLPKTVIGAYGLTDTIAIGHIFLTTNMSLKNGDTIRLNDWASSGIIGSCGGMSGGPDIVDEAIIYKIGKPSFAGLKVQDQNPSKSIPDGFIFFSGDRHDINDKTFEVGTFYYPALTIALHVTDNNETKRRNFFYLSQ